MTKWILVAAVGGVTNFEGGEEGRIQEKKDMGRLKKRG